MQSGKWYAGLDTSLELQESDLEFGRAGQLRLGVPDLSELGDLARLSAPWRQRRLA